MSGGIPLPQSDAESELSKLVEAAKGRAFTVEETAELARHLAASGQSLSWPAHVSTADVASTGGPGSLSTLVAPIGLLAAGRCVVKLAVPGRPAGAIDALGTVPGYRTRLSGEEIVAVLAGCGYAHFLADARFAPLDAALYSFRRKVGAVALPDLAIASLLSKKLAVSVRSVGLDVRVGPHGNFGETRAAAAANAKKFCEVARHLGLEATAFVSATTPPVQPWIGRGESLVATGAAVGALRLDGSSRWLEEHVSECLLMAAATAGAIGVAGPAGEAAIREALRRHLKAQGAGWEGFVERAQVVLGADRHPLKAQADGWLSYDLDLIRKVIVDVQDATRGDGFADPAGLELVVRPGQPVRSGQEVARVRCELGHSATAGLLSRLQGAVVVETRAPIDMAGSPSDSGGPAGMEIVRA